MLPPLHLVSLNVSAGLRVEGLKSVDEVDLAATTPSQLGLLQDLLRIQRPSRLQLWLRVAAVPGCLVAMQQAASALGGCSNLTCLEVDCRDDVSGVPWCSEIAKLSCLQSLSITDLNHQSPSHWLQLTALSGLHTLSLLNVEGMDDFVACSLLGRLRGLQDLEVMGESLQTMAVLGCVTLLTNLTSLWLDCWKPDVGVDSHHLQALKPLTNLQEVFLPVKGSSVPSVTDLQAAIPRLHFSYRECSS